MAKKKDVRTIIVGVRLTAAEHQDLVDLADGEGIRETAEIRLLIKREIQRKKAARKAKIRRLVGRR